MGPGRADVRREPRSGGVDVAARRLLALAVACTLLVVALYAVFARTEVGQRIDDAALEGRAALSTADVQNARELLDTVSLASVALLGGAIVLVAAVRGGPMLAGVAVFVLAGANATTQAMKAVLARPELIVDDYPSTIGNTLPSGHTTVATSIAIAAILVAPRRLRGPVAIVGVAYAAAVGVAVLTTGAHRPSDAAAAYAVVVAWAAAAAWLLVAARAPARGPLPIGSSSRLVTPMLVVVGVAMSALAFVGVVGVLTARRLGRLEAVDLGQAYGGAVVAIVGSALLLTGLLLAALRPVALEVPPESGPANGGRDASERVA